MASGTTTNGLEIIKRRHFSSPDAARDARTSAYRTLMEIAQVVYDLRENAGCSVDEFAARVGLSPEAINDLEEADFQGDVLWPSSRSPNR